MVDLGTTIDNLELNIRWIEDIPAHQFPGWGNTTAAMRDAVELLKEQEARKGHWIEDETETYTENHDTWECSECHEPFTLTEGTPEENKFYFCPRCGADMR